MATKRADFKTVQVRLTRQDYNTLAWLSDKTMRSSYSDVFRVAMIDAANRTGYKPKGRKQ